MRRLPAPHTQQNISWFSDSLLKTNDCSVLVMCRSDSLGAKHYFALMNSEGRTLPLPTEKKEPPSSSTPPTYPPTHTKHTLIRELESNDDVSVLSIRKRRSLVSNDEMVSFMNSMCTADAGQWPVNLPKTPTVWVRSSTCWTGPLRFNPFQIPAPCVHVLMRAPDVGEKTYY